MPGSCGVFLPHGMYLRRESRVTVMGDMVGYWESEYSMGEVKPTRALRSAARRRIRRVLAATLATVLAGSAMVLSGTGLPAAEAAEGSSLMLVKHVKKMGGSFADEARDLRPGDSVTYRVEFRVNDEDADAPVLVSDVLPAEFEGWEIAGLTAMLGGRTAGVTLALDGVTSGAAPSAPSAGTIGAGIDARTITVGVEQPVQAGDGNLSGLGMSTRDTGVLEYTIKVPDSLAPDSPVLRRDLVNTATFTAKSGLADLMATDTALISVDNPIAIDVTPTKTWNPGEQSFEPGACSTISIGATQASNVPVSTLTLQDPSDPTLAPGGATTLPLANPFNFVDFAGFADLAAPGSQLPAGADSSLVEVYHLSGGTWTWVPWDASMEPVDIAGVRVSYFGVGASIDPGAQASQSFVVTQRSTHRATNESVSTGYRADNTVRATVEAPGQEPVSKEAEAALVVTPEQIEVASQKHFYSLPNGTETTGLTGVTAGDTVGVVLRAKNEAVPASSVLDRLTITEPGAGSNEKFFGTHLIFGGFLNADSAAVWPAGATGGSATWTYADNTNVTIDLAQGAALPAPNAAKTLTGFELSFSGAIDPGATSEVRYALGSSSDESFVAAGAQSGALKNTIVVTGEKRGFDDETSTSSATVAYVAPKIETTIDKRVGPGVVMPGQDVVVQLDTEVQATGGRTQPTEIVVSDELSGAGTFWDAFDATQILPPVSRPSVDGVQADLTIRYRNAAGYWVDLATNPSESAPIAVPAGAAGLKFVYSHPTGFSQVTYVKPNIEFVARNSLRSDASVPTGSAFEQAKQYTNVATVEATGKLDDRDVAGSAKDTVDAGIRGSANGSGPGVGGLWTDKDWRHDTLTSQSGVSSWTTQKWVVAQEGYASVTLQDPAVVTKSGQGTVFEAFNLTHIRPIHYSGSAAGATIDPRLKWDLVTAVELWDGNAWIPALAPDGSWMNTSGFKGYTLTAAERASTLGVRLVLTENAPVREAAHNTESPDLTAPRPGSGVASSADIREYRLDWQMRDRARTADGSLKWVKETDTAFNCEGAGDGCVDNVFSITARPAAGAPVTDAANDTIQIIDGATNVTFSKVVQAVPGNGPGVESLTMVVPNLGELDQSDYPRARYTLTASNASTVPSDSSHGAMKLGKIRVTDTSNVDPSTGQDIDTSPFTGNDFREQVEQTATGNHFDTFTLTGVSFGSLATYIDATDSTVELWLYDGTNTAGTTRTWTLKQVIDRDPGFIAALPQAIGISVTYSGDDPAQNGNRIRVGDNFVMHLDVQLRATERLSGLDIAGGPLGSVVTVPNEALARGWDAVVAPKTQPMQRDEAKVDLTAARVDVELAKSISVDHGDASDTSLTEAAPTDPVAVELTATPHGATAPLNTLTITDTTESFWERFEFVGFAPLTLPTDADRATQQVLVGSDWIDAEGYDGDPSDIVGVRVVFDRADAQLFPLGATSWSASWDTARLPFTVKLRAEAAVDWAGDRETNEASVTARNTEYGSATDRADAEVTFTPGVHSLRVEKRAPNDTSSHEVEALASMPWKLIFTNTGTSYLPITSVTDMLPAELSWDGEAPVVTSSAGTSGESGLVSTPDVHLSDDARSLVFTWEPGARMHPGEKVEIALGLVLQPVVADLRATNEVIVQAGVDLDSCEQPREFGQNPSATGDATTCSNTNYVQPRAGTVIGARKTVSGEPGATLGENLVGGAFNTRTLDECELGNFLPVASDFTRNPCASYTAVGSIDRWKLENINSGTNPIARMTIVDMLPVPGDRMLAGGAERGSTFSPVLLDTDAIRLSGLPEGASYTIEVTEHAAACVGTQPGSSLWASDPECADTAANPANVWMPLTAYAGSVERISGLRFSIDMTQHPLEPGGNVIVEFDTVNRVVDTGEHGLRPTLDQFVERQFAWNQNGAIAWDLNGNRVNLPAAPQRAGVTVKTGALVISKEVTGLGTDRAPESFDVELECTVPSGVADPERVPLDLGEQTVVEVPKNGSVRVDGIPVGADCSARESGALGSYDENQRLIGFTDNVAPSVDGQSAEVRVRELDGEEPTEILFVNAYAPIPPKPVDPESPEGPKPTSPLSVTGGFGGEWFLATAALIVAIGAVLLSVEAKRKRRRHG